MYCVTCRIRYYTVIKFIILITGHNCLCYMFWIPSWSTTVMIDATTLDHMPICQPQDATSQAATSQDMITHLYYLQYYQDHVIHYTLDSIASWTITLLIKYLFSHINIDSHVLSSIILMHYILWFHWCPFGLPILYAKLKFPDRLFSRLFSPNLCFVPCVLFCDQFALRLQIFFTFLFCFRFSVSNHFVCLFFVSPTHICQIIFGRMIVVNQVHIELPHPQHAVLAGLVATMVIFTLSDAITWLFYCYLILFQLAGLLFSYCVIHTFIYANYQC